MVKRRRSFSGPDSHDWDARAQEALDAARKLPHGPARSAAMKEAGRLRVAADTKDFLASSTNRPEDA